VSQEVEDDKDFGVGEESIFIHEYKLPIIISLALVYSVLFPRLRRLRGS